MIAELNGQLALSLANRLSEAYAEKNHVAERPLASSLSQAPWHKMPGNGFLEGSQGSGGSAIWWNWNSGQISPRLATAKRNDGQRSWKKRIIQKSRKSQVFPLFCSALRFFRQLFCKWKMPFTQVYDNNASFSIVRYHNTFHNQTADKALRLPGFIEFCFYKCRTECACGLRCVESAW